MAEDSHFLLLYDQMPSSNSDNNCESIAPAEEANIPMGGFEGCEKRLMVQFAPTADLRSLSRATIDAMLTEAKCTIISQKSTQHFDAYVLSESSLFVFANKVILKTCGTTTLLNGLPTLIQATKDIGTEPVRVQYSRYDFLFPEKQPYPHNSFASEVEYLNTFFNGGRAYVLGSQFTAYTAAECPSATAHLSSANPSATPRWHLYIADCASSNADGEESRVPSSLEHTFEMVMFDLDRRVMRQFYRPSDDDKSHPDGFVPPSNSEDATRMSGIDLLVPGSEIDAFLFNPCGYSCNGLKDDIYFTIHVTPEPQCSFVSFESSVPMTCYTELIERLVEVFRPGSFCVSVFSSPTAFVPNASGAISTEAAAEEAYIDARMRSEYTGYETESATTCQLENGYAVHCGQFVSLSDPVCLHHPARATTQMESKLVSKAPVYITVKNDVVVSATSGPGGAAPKFVSDSVDNDAVSGDSAPASPPSKSTADSADFADPISFPSPYQHDYGMIEADDLSYDINER